MDKKGEWVTLDLDVKDVECQCCNSSCIRTKSHKCCPMIHCFKYLRKKKLNDDKNKNKKSCCVECCDVEK